MYEMQIKIQKMVLDNKEEWVSVRPSGGSPYQYLTEADAQRMLNICYRDVDPSKKRVGKVQDD